jgi:hypothetical protein
MREKIQFTVIVEKDEDGFFVATVPALRSCYTQARTLEELYPRSLVKNPLGGNVELNPWGCDRKVI